MELALDWLGGDRSWLNILKRAGAAWNGRVPTEHALMWYVGTSAEVKFELFEVAFLRQDYRGTVEKVVMEIATGFGACCVKKTESMPFGFSATLVPPLPFYVRVCLDWAYEARRLMMIGKTKNISESNCLIAEFRFAHVEARLVNSDGETMDEGMEDDSPTEIGGGYVENCLHTASFAGYIVETGRDDPSGSESGVHIGYF